MASILQRHPRYSLLSFVLLLVTFLLLASQRAPPSIGHYYDEFDYTDDQDALAVRLAQSERIYQRVLTLRAGLVKKFGPTPEQVAM